MKFRKDITDRVKKYLAEHPETGVEDILKALPGGAIARHPAFRGQLKELSRRRKNQLRKKFQETVAKQGEEYRRGVDDTYVAFSIIEERLKSDLAYSNRQLELARGNIEFKDAQLRDMRTRQLVPLLKAVEGSFANSAILYLGPDSQPIYGSPKFLEVLHVSEAELVSLDVKKLFSHLDRKSRESLTSYSSAGAYQPTRLNLKVDGTERYVEVSTKPVYDAGEELIGTLVTFTDVGIFDRLLHTKGRGRKLLENILSGVHSSLHKSSRTSSD